MASNSKSESDGRFRSEFKICDLLPPPFSCGKDGICDDELKPIHVRLDRVQNLNLNNFQKSVMARGKTLARIQLRLSLFDVTHHQFFGRTLSLPETTVTTGKTQNTPSSVSSFGIGKLTVEVKHDTYLFLSAWSATSTIVICVEVVGCLLANDGGKATDDSKGTSVSLGWTVLRPLLEPTTDARQVRLYQGTPRALLHLEEPIESNPLMQPIGEDCRLVYSIDYPKRLLKLRRLLPPGVLVTDDDSIPGSIAGVRHLTRRENGVKLQRSTPLHIGDIRLYLSPSLDAFEDELCRSVRDDLKSGATSVVEVTERRLRVGVHNGWCYLRTPQVVHLSADIRRRHRHIKTGGLSSTSVGMAPNLTRALSWSPSRIQSAAEAVVGDDKVLSFEGRIALTEMREDADLLVTFGLEYVLTVNESSSSVRPILPPARATTVLLCTAVWRPYQSDNRVDDVISITLVGGPVHNPEQTLVYRSRGGGTSSKGSGRVGELRLRFDWSDGKRRSTSLDSLGVTRPVPPLVSSRQPSGLEKSGKRHSSTSSVHTDSSHVIIGTDSKTDQPSNDVEPALKSIREQNKSSTREGDGGCHFLLEIPCSQGPRLPIVALNTRSMLGAVPLSRSAYAKLYATGLPPILDRHGRPPDIVDPARPTSPYLSSKEQSDPLQCNLIIFQFLAFTHRSTSFAEPRTMFFAFQFHRHPPCVTERLLLGRSELDFSGDPHEGATHLLRRVTSDGAARQGPAGFEVKYCVDPTGVGCSAFGDVLNESRLHLDVWDGDSLMFVGNTAVELRDLCRQGREGVQVTFELDVVFAPTVEDDDDVYTSSSNREPTPKSCVRGRLLLRLANIGYPYGGVVSGDDARKIDDVFHSTNTSGIVVSSVDLPARNLITRNRISVAKSLLLDTDNSGLARWRSENVIVTDSVLGEVSNDKINSEEIARKLVRMNLVRSSKSGSTTSCPNSKILSTSEQRLRDCKTAEKVRELAKSDVIRNHLNNWVGVQHRIVAAQGSAEYFEFELMNPLKVEQSVAVEIDDGDLRIVVDSCEWQTFRKLNSHRMSSSHAFEPPIEERMFSNFDRCDGSPPQLLLKPRERVRIPLRYQNFDCCAVSDDAYNLFQYGLEFGTDRVKNKSSSSSKLCQVRFRGEDGAVFAVLCLTVDNQTPSVDQILRFQHAENSFLKRHVRFWHSRHRPSSEGVASVVCTDQHVTAEIAGGGFDDPVDVLIKVPCGGSGSVRSFLLFVYGDSHRISPVQTCRVTVQTLQRIDVSCVTGQSTRHSVVLRGGRSTRLVRCFSSLPNELQLIPGGDRPFVLAAHDRLELSLVVKSLADGFRFAYVHAVDVEFHVLLHCWMVGVRCKPPTVTRSFQIRLPLGGGLGSNKRISYRNPYLERRVFHLSTNRPDRVQFRESAFDVAGNCSHVIGLVFLPCSSRVSENVLVFINNEDEINEETFCVKTTYG